jgi:DNA polymerase III subunit epsilon
MREPIVSGATIRFSHYQGRGMREVVLDTETTGFDPLKGDRLVEIGCVELVNHVATGRHFQVYLNPERDMPTEAEAIHGLTTEFLADKPVFSNVVDDFLNFIQDSPLVIHNASFDMKFINAELQRIGMPVLANRVIDTVPLARKRFPGGPASLDALCRRFGFDLSDRSLHGALLDSQLLANVYLELLGGRQPGLALGGGKQGAPQPKPETAMARQEGEAGPALHGANAGEGCFFRPRRPHAPSPAEIEAHTRFVAALKGALWLEDDQGR